MTASGSPLRLPVLKTPLTVILTTFNSMRTLPRVFASLDSLEARLIVVDSGSTDQTVAFAREQGAEVVFRAWDFPAAQKQFALDRAVDSTWVLLLDSDESLEPELAESIREAVRRDQPEVSAYVFRRKLCFAGAWLHHTFQPEWRLRLVRGGAGRCVSHGRQNRGPHDRLEVDGATARLAGICRHDSWAGAADMLRSYLRYAELHAAQVGTGGRALNVLLNGPWAFLKFYLIKQGWRDGWRGFVVCAAAAWGSFAKHLLVFAGRRQHGIPSDQNDR